MSHEKGSATPIVDELVVNWHVTEGCNYRCKYCFAHWDGDGREVIRDDSDARRLVGAIAAFFDRSNTRNPLRKRLQWRSIRLNLAGGEPLLHKKRVIGILEYARQIGLQTSLITNGSLLPDGQVLRRLAAALSILGISADAVLIERNEAIGRIDSKGNSVSLDDLVRRLRLAREYNLSLRVKLNTVVNARNFNEDLTALVHRIAPEKWKVLRVLPVGDQRLSISDEQYAAFLHTHESLMPCISAEDNTDMTESYLMIDPLGRFFQNQSTAGRFYLYSKPILDVGVQVALSSIPFSVERFVQRYSRQLIPRAITLRGASESIKTGPVSETVPPRR